MGNLKISQQYYYQQQKFRSSLWLLVMGSVTLITCIPAAICMPIVVNLLKNNIEKDIVKGMSIPTTARNSRIEQEFHSRSKGAKTCFIGSGGTVLLCLVACFGIQIWVRISILLISNIIFLLIREAF